MTATDKPANDTDADTDSTGEDAAAAPGHETDAHEVEVVNEYDRSAAAAAYARAQGPGKQADAGGRDRAAAPESADPGAAESGTAESGTAEPGGAETGEAGTGLTETETALLAENQALREQALRTLAEMDNLRKRTVREKEDAARFAISKFAKDLLPVGDNLQRALQAIPEGAGADNPLLQTLADGIGAVDRELDSVLERHGVRKVEALGAPFDANLHEAVMEQPTADHAPGHVAQVFQTGYTLNDRLLRPAMVAVAKAP